MARGTFVHLGAIRERRVRAYVPHGAEERAPRPLLVMFDGQNLFGDAGSFAGGWHIHEAIDAVDARRVAPIVVAIDHGGVERIAELAPVSDGRRGGGFPVLLAAIVDELMPRVRARFALAEGPRHHFIGGSSLGGLAAIYAHLTRPDVFGGALAMSPSLWFARARFAAALAHVPAPAWSRMYLDIGAREGEGKTAPITVAFARGLRRSGWREPAARRPLRVMVRVDPRGTHDERAWRRRFPRALRFLLAR